MGTIRVSPRRLRERIEHLGSIGRDPAGGVTRLPFAPSHVDAVQQLAQMMRAAGLSVGVDDFGTLVGQRAGQRETWLLAGSHLDTVPQGGMFDGALGVVAAVECAQALQEAGVKLRHGLAILAFADEEGHAFGVGTLSSRALVGEVSRTRFAELRDGGGHSFDAYLRARDHGLPVRRVPDRIAAYLELHVEQGPVLEQMGGTVAAVDSITGILRTPVVMVGRAGHAGTTPMQARADALVGAAELILGVRELAMHQGDRAVGTVGRVQALPGATNIIPGRVELTVELRSPDADVLAGLRDEVEQRAREIAGRHHLALTWGAWDLSPPVRMDPGVHDAVLRAIDRCGHPRLSLPSWAGHDAGVLARYAPAGMIFVVSRGGLSHAPGEHTPWDAVETGAQVLLDTLLQLDETDTDRRLPLAYATR
jgi:hydantoinase/carbamoylase family amidase